MRRWLSFARSGALAGAVSWCCWGCNGGAQAQPVSSLPPSSASVARDAPRVITSVDPSPHTLAVLAAPDRSADDRALDEPRQSAALLTYLDVGEGMNVAELAAGAGYVTEMLARSVGHQGRIFAENPPSLLAKHGLDEAWKQRLARPAGARVVRLDDELDRPLPMHALDLVYVSDELGDLAADGVQPGAGAAAAWNSLRSGGRFVVVSHSEANGEPRADSVSAIERCGFRRVSDGRFFKDARVAVTFVKP
jgi:predicted methyltransferase